nr:MAG TPA: hypothetical protein [Caudoviricetes sp.]
MLPPGAGECRKTQAAGRDRGIRHPSVFRPMPLWADLNRSIKNGKFY